MLEKMWLFRFRYGFQFPERIGPFESWDHRREVYMEIWEQEPDAILYQVDVYPGGDVRMSIPPRHVA